MKKIVINARLLLVLLTGLLSAHSYAQSEAIKELDGIKTHIIKSNYLTKEYCLRVLLPANYSASDTTKYPVMYVLDGKYSTALFYSLIETFALGKELKDLIVVTIDGNNLSESEWLISRYHDYTPSYRSHKGRIGLRNDNNSKPHIKRKAWYYRHKGYLHRNWFLGDRIEGTISKKGILMRINVIYR